MLLEEASHSTPESLFNNFFSLNVKLLRFGGLASMDAVFTGSNKKHSLWGTLLIVTALISICFCQFGVVNSVIINWNINQELVIQSVSAIISTVLGTFKGLELFLKRQDLQEILQRLRTLWVDAYKIEASRDIMLKLAGKAHFITRFYASVCAATIFSFLLIPVRHIFQRYFTVENGTYTHDLVPMNPSIYPFDLNNIAVYIPIILTELFVGTMLVLFYASSGSMFCQLISHLSIHFEILRYDLENVIDHKSTSDVSIEDDNIAIKKLIDIAKRHKELYSFCDIIHSVYKPILFTTAVTVSIITGLCIFQMQERFFLGEHIEALKQALHLTIPLGQLYLFCLFANTLSDQTELVAMAAYSCPWPDLGRDFNDRLRILMVRAQRAFYCAPYGFFRVNLNQFSTVVSTAFTYFTLLNTVVKKDVNSTG